MRVLKAYADAARQMPGRGMIGNHINSEAAGTGHQPQSASLKERKSSGDTLSLSDEAREMLGQNGNISLCPQDATYDQNGYIMRQVENVQGDLRNLASSLLSVPGGQALSGQIKGLQNHLGSIQAQV